MEFRNHLNADKLSCSMLMNHFAINQTSVSPANSYLLVETVTWFLPLLWLITLAIMVTRLVFVVDFELVHVVIYKITDPEMLKQLTKQTNSQKIIYESQTGSGLIRNQSKNSNFKYRKLTEDVSNLSSKQEINANNELDVKKQLSKIESIDTTDTRNELNSKHVNESTSMSSAVKFLGDIFVDVNQNDSSSDDDVKSAVPLTGLYDAIKWKNAAKLAGSVIKILGDNETESLNNIENVPIRIIEYQQVSEEMLNNISKQDDNNMPKLDDKKSGDSE